MSTVLTIDDSRVVRAMIDHAQAGSILAENWGLAPEQCDAIRWHHDPSKAGVGRDLAAVLNAADWFAYHIGFGTNAESLTTSH